MTSERGECLAFQNVKRQGVLDFRCRYIGAAYYYYYYYTVSQKHATKLLSIIIFTKCQPMLKILLLAHSVENLSC